MKPIARRAAFFLVAIGGIALFVGMLLAVGRENALDEPVAVDEPVDTSGLLGWACPEGTVSTVTCGFVEVPVDHDDPEIDFIRLFVAVLAGPGEDSGPPLLVLGDRIGPGVVGDLSSWRQLSRDLDRGLVLVDLRGTGSSEPQLSCIELLKSGWLEVDLGDEQAVRLARQQRRGGVQRCRERVEEVPSLNTLEVDIMAKDLRHVREQLGIERWVLVGTAATAEVAVATEAVDGDAVDALVLLAAAPATDEPLDQRWGYGKEVLLAALDCDRADCRGDPEFEVLLEAEEALGQRSVVFTTEVGSSRRRVSVNQGSMFATLALGVHRADLRGSLPSFIDNLADRQWRPLATLRGEEFPLLQYGLISASLSLNCDAPPAALSGPIAEPPPSPEPSAEDDSGEEQPQAAAVTQTNALEDLRSWYSLTDDPILDPDLCRPSRSVGIPAGNQPASPVLIINQTYDYRAPASAAGALASSWPDATVLVLDEGDRPDLRNDCVVGPVSEFLDGGPTIEASCE